MAQPTPMLDAVADRLMRLTQGRTSAPRLKDGVLTLVLDVTGLGDAARAAMETDIRAAIGDGAYASLGVTDVRVAMTAEKRGMRIVAVGSGKGGVGKSTVSANLAVALKRLGLAVGLVDADVYGPSQPRLMGSGDERPRADADKKLVPIMSRFGVPLLSMGHLVAEGQAIAWRGPMASNALGQLIDASWGNVDTLIVDLPPGTGDVQLSMLQKHKPAGAVIVSTPQDLALIDARRAVNLFQTGGVPMIGLIENMAGYACPDCGRISDPFGRGGAEAAAAQMAMPFLGRIPLAIDIRAASDAGQPPAAADGVNGAPFMDIAGKVRDWLAKPR